VSRDVTEPSLVETRTTASAGQSHDHFANSHLYSASWVVWANSSEHSTPLIRSIDHALRDYVFYPEAEWARFGYRPPEDSPLSSAWRDPDGHVFVFLLEGTAKRHSARNEKPLLLYVSGLRTAVEQVGTRIAALKSGLAKLERKELRIIQAGHRIDEEKKSPSLARLFKLVAFFTVIVNAFSLFLWRLPPPNLPVPWAQHTFQFAVIAVSLAALTLLLTIILVGIAYAIRYGVLVLRRM
jgi:hypothetical protein